MDLRDQQIVEAINKGDQAVFKTIFDHYFQRLYLSSLKLVREQDIAEEIVHDVFVSLWNRAEPITLHTSFEGYIFRSIRNRSINYLNKKYVNTETGLEEQVFHLASGDDSNASMELKELNELIQVGLDKMSPTTKTVFSLSRFEDLSYKEIADQLGCTIKNVEYHMGKSLKFLRGHLADYGYILILVYCDLFNFSLLH